MSKSILIKSPHDPELAKIFDDLLAATAKTVKNHSLKVISDYAPLATLFKQIKCDQLIKSALMSAELQSEDKPIHFFIKNSSTTKKITISKYEHQLLTLMGLTQHLLMWPGEIRAANFERGDIPEAEYFKGDRRTIILNAFAALGISTPQQYTTKFPICLIVCGGFLFRFWNRMEQTAIPFMKQHKVIELIIADGLRPLKEDKRDIDFLKEKFPQRSKEIDELDNELNAAEFIIKIFQADFPELFNAVAVSYTNTLPKLGFSRAHTDDVAGEVKVTPNLEIVIVSDAPFTLYQLETHRLMMHDSSIMAIGAGADPSYPIEDYYDALARLLYITTLQVISQNHPQLTAAEIEIITKKYKADYSKSQKSVITENAAV